MIVATSEWGVSQWVVVIAAATAGPVAIALAVFASASARKAAIEASKVATAATQGMDIVGRKVDAVHQEITPPSNGTTAGAY